MTTIARQSDGSIQLALNVPWKKVLTERAKAALVIGKNTTVPGFRKGKAPVEAVLKHVSEEELNQAVLNVILPTLYSKAIRENKITPAIYPKFEIISINNNKDWQIRAITCEMPKFSLGEYKKGLKSIQIKVKKKMAQEETEQKIMQYLVENIEIVVPDIIIEDEVNARLSGLIQRIEKLGLDLDKYLDSIKKTPDQLRKEYRESAKNAIKLDMIFNRIYKEEKLAVSKKEIDDYIAALKADPNFNESDMERQKSALKSVLRRRKVLDKLSALVQ